MTKQPLLLEPSIQINNCELSKIRPLKATTKEYIINDAFKFYDCEDFFKQELDVSVDRLLGTFESPADFARLNETHFQNLNDKQNRFKLVVYMIKCLSIRILLTYDELNCVQIVQLIYDFMNRLIDKSHNELFIYCILEVLMKDLNLFVDLIDENDPNSHLAEILMNKKMSTNTFFMHNLISKHVNKLILLIGKFILKLKEDQNIKVENFQPALVCIISRLYYILVKCVIKKLTQFNSVIDLAFLESLSIVNEQVFGLKSENSDELKLKCLTGLNVLHLFSLLPFNTLIRQYERGGGVSSAKVYEDLDNDDCNNNSSSKSCSEDEHSLEKESKKCRNDNVCSHLEVLTKKCKNVWELFVIKKSFTSAKGNSVLFIRNKLD